MRVLFLICQFIFISSFYSQEVNAVYNKDVVEISWSNPQHNKIDYFVIEKSKKGDYFKEIMTVKVIDGNANSVQYFELDYNPFKKKAYYRIKQVNINNEKYYSNVVLAKNNSNVKPIFNFFSKTSNSKLKGYVGNNVLVVLLDVNHEEFIAKIDVIEESKELVVTSVNVKLPSGNYVIKATSDENLYGKKINVYGNYASSVY